MYAWAAPRTALPVAVLISTLGGPALSTSTLPTFKTEVLTSSTLGRVVVGVAWVLLPPLEHPVKPSVSTSARPAASALHRVGKRGLRVGTGAIFAFAERYLWYREVEAARARTKIRPEIHDAGRRAGSRAARHMV